MRVLPALALAALGSGASLFAATPAAAGVPPPNDDCSTPSLIAGTGTFLAAMSNATTSFVTPTCFFSTPDSDVWFQWTAPMSGMATVAFCPYSTLDDTMLAIWTELGCPAGSSLVCDDDGCDPGPASIASFVVTAGNVYTIQAGMFPGNLGVDLNFDITIAPVVPPPSNDECTNPIVLSGPGVYAHDAASATLSLQQNSACANLHKDVWYTYQATVTGTATLTTCGTLAPGSDQDTKVAVYAGAGCPAGSEIACDDDDSSCLFSTLNSTLTWPIVCGGSYTIQLGQFDSSDSISGSFNISEAGACTPVPSVPYCFGDGIQVSCPCNNSGAATNGCANSANAAGANLMATGNFSISADTASLVGAGMPASGPALYFQGTEKEVFGFGSPFGDGLRCASGTMVRLGVKFNIGGLSVYPSGSQPISVQGANTAGTVRLYQVMYRDADPVFCPMETFNLTNGIEASWTP